ncbi:hypothetical protein HUG17_5670 [Dermatophagoides farinae]|uniref:Uncharacterized protein n=1 Tax=Dermatophagoides farinae TaxID=6954 RepID=A0A9D4SIB9_DERFA|nr:hypothetical protein HUG17_5670 [Dermatophagoides farinae]
MRIDYHLERIMKHNRLINFKNSIRSFSIYERILECLLEITNVFSNNNNNKKTSTQNIIGRRQNLIRNGHHFCHLLLAIIHSKNDRHWKQQILIELFPFFKEICTNLGQLIWALNSNKEHIRYVCKVFALPEYYFRCTSSTSLYGGEFIPIKAIIIQMNRNCLMTIHECETIRMNIHHMVKEIYFN